MRRSLSIIEVTFSLAVVTVSVLMIVSAQGSAIQVTRGSKPAMVAARAAERVVEELRATSQPIAAFYANFWGQPGEAAPYAANPGAPGRGAFVVGGDSAGVYYDLDQVNIDEGGVQTAFDEVLGPAVANKLIRRASDGGGFLRLRFLSEAEYNLMWPGLAADLNQDGDVIDGIQRDGSGSNAGPDYLLYPLLIEVHWADEAGDHVLRHTTVISAEADLDPDRS
jgi:hypothetical protein